MSSACACSLIRPRVHHQDDVRVADGAQPVQITKDVRPSRSSAIACWIRPRCGCPPNSSPRRGSGSAGWPGTPARWSAAASPGRQVRGLVVEQGVVAVGHGPHEVVDRGCPRRIHDLLLGRPRRRTRCCRGSSRRTARCPAAPCRSSAARRRGPCPCRHPSSRIARVDVVEPHQQVDQRRLAGAGRPRRSPPSRRAGPPGSGPRSAGCRVAERDVAELHVPGGVPAAWPCSTSGLCSSASSSSNTRSAGRDPDCSRFVIDASCVIGIVNCREYWMNACTSPGSSTRSRPGSRRSPRSHVVQVRDERHRRLDDPGDELRPEARGVHLLVGVVELLDRLGPAGRRP